MNLHPLTPHRSSAARRTGPVRGDRRVIPAALAVPLAAVVIGAGSSARSAPPTDSMCSSSPLEVAATALAMPAEQLRAQVDAAVEASGRPALDVLLERVALPVEQLYLEPEAGNGPDPDAVADLIDRYNAARAVLRAHAWGECSPDLTA